jgi:hypothetical protein
MRRRRAALATFLRKTPARVFRSGCALPPGFRALVRGGPGESRKGVVGFAFGSSGGQSRNVIRLGNHSRNLGVAYFLVNPRVPSEIMYVNKVFCHFEVTANFFLRRRELGGICCVSAPPVLPHRHPIRPVFLANSCQILFYIVFCYRCG